MKNQMNKNSGRKRRPKTNLVFDDTARKDYLTGFHKRKNERRKRAQHEQKEKEREERIELRKQKRELLQRQMRKGLTSVPEIEDLADPEVYSFPNHTVTITDVSNMDMAGQDGLRLGQNTFVKEDEKASKPTEKKEDTPVDVKKKLKKIGEMSKRFGSQQQKFKNKKKSSTQKFSKNKSKKSSKKSSKKKGRKT
ncbi:hypothetical protein ScPMuIL_004773 [Solemya velum]